MCYIIYSEGKKNAITGKKKLSLLGKVNGYTIIG
jgi:hypothetical protein